MAGVLNNLMWNALEASLLALLVVAAVRFCRISAPARHMLWLIVLLKLFVPPVAVHSIGLSGWCARAAERATGYAAGFNAELSPKLGLSFAPSDSILEPVEINPIVEIDPVASIGEVEKSDFAMSFDVFVVPEIIELSVPAMVATDANQSVPTSPALATHEASPRGEIPASRVTRWIGLLGSPRSRLLFLGWLGGAVCLAAIRVRQSVSILRMLRIAKPAPARIVTDCISLAKQMGVRRVPAVRIVDRPVSPMVCVLGRATIVLPAKLTERYDRTVVRSVLAHELAHLKRRDHWVCWIELVAGCAYWWLPTFWLACRAMRRAADEAADAWAVEILGCRQKYAESLLETVDLLVADRAVAPAWGPALGERDTIARRLTMIMREPLCPRLSWPARLGIALVGLLVLPAAPQRLKAQDAPKPPATIPSDDEIAAAVELLDPAAPQRPGDSRPDQPQPRDRRPDGPRSPDAGPSDLQRGQPGGGDRRRDAQRPPEAGQRDSQRPQPPATSGRGDGQRDPERRLQELEAKLDRIMQMLESRPGQPGVGPGAGVGPAAGGEPGPQGGFTPFGGRGPGGGNEAGASTGAGRGFGGAMTGSRFSTGGAGGTGMGGAAGGMVLGRSGQGPGGVEDMLRGIELNPEQRERIEHAMKDVQAEIQKVEAEQARAMQEFQHRRMEFERKRAEIIRDVLSPEQRERMQQRGPAGERPRERGDARPDGREGARPEGRGEGRGGPDRPREATEPRRDGGPERSPEGARGGRGGPGPDRPREAIEPRRGPEGERPREGGEPRRRPESERPEEEAGFNAEAFGFFVGMFR